MKDETIEILEKVIDLGGDCLDAQLCKKCPFKRKCLPNFLQEKQQRPTQKERFNLALDTITNISLLEDESLVYARE
jgi:hypothetical protein